MTIFSSNIKASKDDGGDFRSLLKHREFAKQKLEADAGEKVDLKHGVCDYMIEFLLMLLLLFFTLK